MRGFVPEKKAECAVGEGGGAGKARRRVAAHRGGAVEPLFAPETTAQDAWLLRDASPPQASILVSNDEVRFAEDGLLRAADGSLTCEVCGVGIEAETAWTAHVLSTVHQVRRVRHVAPRTVMLSGKGYDMLRAAGWHEEAGKGLGKDGEGRIEPIPTVLRQNRLGVGSAGPDGVIPRPRVTHFPSHSEADVGEDGLSTAKRGSSVPIVPRDVLRRRFKAADVAKKRRQQIEDRLLELDFDLGGSLSGDMRAILASAPPPNGKRRRRR